MIRRHLHAIVLGAALLGVGCEPGVGRQLSAHDYAFAFTQRDDITIRTLSTPSLREAVWDRLEGAQEFRRIAALLGHGQHGEVVDSQFKDNEALVQFRTTEGAQYRLYAVYQQDEWKVDDVVKEKAPGEYVSMRRQAEAVLAVRDFRRALEKHEPGALALASSDALTREAWAKMSRAKVEGAQVLEAMLSGTEGEVGEVFPTKHEKWAAKVGAADKSYTFYFVTERGRLVVDDVTVPGSEKPLRVILREMTAG